MNRVHNTEVEVVWRSQPGEDLATLGKDLDYILTLAPQFGQQYLSKRSG